MNFSLSVSTYLLVAAAFQIPVTTGFTDGYLSRRTTGVWGRTMPSRSTTHLELATIAKKASADDAKTSSDSQAHSQSVRAPLKYIGPYPCLALRFPKLATASQRQRNVTGVSLDFVLDTAANVNLINQQVAQQLNLDVVGQALPGVSTAGALAGGDKTYMLGDCQLEGLQLGEDEDPFTFMTDLTASALPIASPASAGLLSLAFLQSFQGGVEFVWGSETTTSGGTPEARPPPSVTFYGDKSMDDKILHGRTKIPIQRIPLTQLPSVTISINGVKVPALLDTGSPITVLNAQAAAAAKIETVTRQKSSKSNNNPFTSVTNRFQEAQAASRGDVLMIMGANGERVSLIKSKEGADVKIPGSDNTKTTAVDFGSVNVYVGELPGLAALNGLGVESPPAVVLGLDVLRQRPSMLLRAQDNEVWFE